MEDFFSAYLSYNSETEVPAVFNRWAAITGIGALLGRQFYIQHGHFTVYPNTYTMLLGSSGTRKSTAIKLMRKFMQEAGYNTIAADKSTKEKFILDLAGEIDDTSGKGKYGKAEDTSIIDELFGEGAKADAEMFIMADEFNDFFGNGNIEFISLLGTLWDYSGVYRNRIKNGKSVSVHNPTISILGGNTPTGFSLAFPTEILGQGFFSRILLIYGEPNGKRIAFPKPPAQSGTLEIVEHLKRIKSICVGPAELTGSGREVLERIYNHPAQLTDVRFESFATRRFTHLLKLCLVICAARGATRITDRDVIKANTVLYYAEQRMPKALGEFGKAKHSDVTHKIMQLLDSADHALSFKEIWRGVSNDLEKMSDLSTMLQNLMTAEKIQALPGGAGFLPKKKVLEHHDSSVLDFSYLTQEELNVSV